MKIKQKLATWALFAVALFAVLGPLLSVYLVLNPALANADPNAPPAPKIVDTIVADGYNLTNTDTQDNSKTGCTATIHKPTALGDQTPLPSGALNLTQVGTDLGYKNIADRPVANLMGSIQGADSTAAAVFNDVAPNNKNMLYIDFKGANGGSNDTLCKDSMALFRESGATDTSTTFYGFWNTGQRVTQGIETGGQNIVVAIIATVNLSTKSVSFTLPNGPNEVNRAGDHSMTLGDPDGVLTAGGTYFPVTGGGGSAAGGGNCLETGETPTESLQQCIDGIPGKTSPLPLPIMFDAATIEFNGDIYTATTWGGGSNDTMTYTLSKPGDDNRLKAGKPIQIVMNTGAWETDINMDSKGSMTEIQNIDRAFKNSQTTGAILNLTLKNVDTGGNGATAILKVPAAGINSTPTDGGGLNSFATYYAKDDVVSLVFTQAGDNEKPYFGIYTRVAGTNDFALADSNWGGKCGVPPAPPNLANFDFGSTDPKSLSAGTTTYNGSGTVTSAPTFVSPVTWNLNASDCSVAHLSVKVAINTTDSAPTPTVKTTGSGPQLDCSVQLFNPLSWILCPLASAFEVVVTGLDDEITNYMDIKGGQGSYNGDQCAPGGAQWCYYYKPWSIVRDISLAVAVVIALIAILSQAFGFEVFDAYTLRRVLPKLLIAIVGITLSWPLMMFFINLFDALGLGIRSLIYAPFQSINKVYLGGGGQLLSALFIRGGLSLLGYAGILSFAVTAAVIIGSALLILILRQIVLYLVVIAMPFVILCSILPATNKGWKFGSDTFWGVLLVFPIAEGMIAAGHAFAVVMSVNAGALSQIIAIVAYLIGYAGVILAPRIAGGAIANIAGFSNGPVRQITGGLSKFRGNKMRENVGAYSTGFKSTGVGTWLEEHKQAGLAGRIATGSGAIIGERRAASTHNTHMGHMAHAAAEALKNNQDAALNDNANSVARNATSRDDFIDRYLLAFPTATRADAVRQANSLERAYGTTMGSDQMQHTATAAALASSPATDSVDERARWMHDAVASHVMTPTQAASHVKASGSLAASAGFGELLQAANGTMSGADLLTAATLGFSPDQSRRMRTGQAREAAKEVLRQADDAYTRYGAGSEQFAKAVADSAGLHDLMNGMTPDVREEFAKHLNGAAVGGRYMREHEAEMERTGNGAYLDRRKVWASGSGPGGAGGPLGAAGGGGGAAGGGP